MKLRGLSVLAEAGIQAEGAGTGCRQGQEEVNGQCVDICKLGTKRDANGRCVPERQGCAKGTEPFKGRCVDICPQGTKRNADGRCITLPQAPSASGARYASAGDRIVFWNKGNAAFIEEDGRASYSDCVADK